MNQNDNVLKTPTIRVMVVEPQASYRHILHQCLGQFGCEMVLLEHTKHLQQYIAQGFFDVIMIDFEAFCQQCDSQKIPLFAGSISFLLCEKKDISQAMIFLSRGISDYLCKPLDAYEIRQKFRLHLQKRKALFDEDKQHFQESQKLKTNPSYLLKNRLSPYVPEELIGTSPALLKLKNQIKKLAHFKSTLWVKGEKGTAKIRVAKLLHQQSHRHQQPFVFVACGALPAASMECILFGDKMTNKELPERQRTTLDGGKSLRRSAQSQQVLLDHTASESLLGQADGGTLYLKDIENLSLSAQKRLVHFLKYDELKPLGLLKPLFLNVRVVVSASMDLLECLADGRLSEELYEQFCLLSLEILPLRKRREDLDSLLSYYLQQLAKQQKQQAKELTADALHVFSRYHWPENLRELYLVLQQMSHACHQPRLDAIDIPHELFVLDGVSSYGVLQ